MTYEKPAELAAQAGFTHLAPLMILKRWQKPNRSTSSIFSRCMPHYGWKQRACLLRVPDVCKKNDLPYYYGADRIAFTGCFPVD